MPPANMKTTALSSASLPKLRTGIFTETDPGEIQKTYKSGASFKGHVRDNVRSGHGIFTWPNGARYEGEYDNNARNGKGVQLWADGSEYTGDFVEDMRHGEGKHIWANGESYTGVFFRDRRHGKGEYRWPDGSWFVGTFYMDKKEGYGTFHFTDGSKFEGLYKDDEREGPGVLTYPDKSEDVGLWHREGLVKICSSLPGAFTMQDHREFEYNPEDHKQFIKVDDAECDRESLQNDIVRAPPAVFDYDPDATNRVMSSFSREASSLYCESLDSRSAAIDRKPFDEEFFKSTLETDNNEIVAWNNTPSSVEMQKHIWKHRHFQKLCSFNVNKILNGERVQESKKGQIECASEKLITAAQTGDLASVKELLDDGKVFVDVSDKSGHTALLGAAVNWYQDVINTLLDHGADVNKLNDEGMSALAACAVFFYPIDHFLYNIAERYMEKPPEVEVALDENVQGILVSDKERGDEKKSGKKGKQRPIQNSDSKTTIDSGVSSPQVSVRRGQKAHKHAKNEMIMDMKTVTKQLLELAPSLKSEPQEEKPEVQRRLRTSTDPGSDSLYDSDEGNSYRELNTPYSGFQSNASVRNFSINVTSQLMERCATQLSQNQMVVDRSRRSSDVDVTGTVRTLAIRKSEYTLMEDTILLLLQRGANPNASSVPMPILFFAIKAADVSMVKALLLKGASTSAKLSNEKGGLAPLHIACAIPGEEGVQITELLLNSLADPDVRAADDDSFLGKTLQEEWSKDVIDDWSRSILGGRTPLHIACARDDYYKNATRVVHLLLQHHANPNLLCNGHSPLSLAITSGNDMAIDFLLKYYADPSLSLTHGVGSALCVASSTEYEHRRTIEGRIALIDKLIKAGANILAPILVGPKRIAGTAVDYAYHMYNLDRRIAHMPYHALTQAERETFNARRKLLAHDGDLLREAAVAKEKMRIEEEEVLGCRSSSPSPDFVFTGAGAPLPPGSRGKASDSKVSFKDSKGQLDGDGTRKPLFKYCYECGRSVGIRLTACTRCKEVFYCSKACKLKAWNARHKEECVRVSGRSRSPSPSRSRSHGRVDSPTPATIPDKRLPASVANLMADKNAMRVKKDQRNTSACSVSVVSLTTDPISDKRLRKGRPTRRGRNDRGFNNMTDDPILDKRLRKGRLTGRDKQFNNTTDNPTLNKLSKVPPDRRAGNDKWFNNRMMGPTLDKQLRKGRPTRRSHNDGSCGNLTNSPILPFLGKQIRKGWPNRRTGNDRRQTDNLRKDLITGKRLPKTCPSPHNGWFDNMTKPIPDKRLPKGCPDRRTCNNGCFDNMTSMANVKVDKNAMKLKVPFKGRSQSARIAAALGQHGIRSGSIGQGGYFGKGTKGGVTSGGRGGYSHKGMKGGISDGQFRDQDDYDEYMDNYSFN